MPMSRGQTDPDFMVKDPSGKLTDQQKQFCHQYIMCNFNGTKAAAAAGYSEKAARNTACVLLDNPDVIAYLKILKDDLGRTLGITRQRVAQELAKIAFYDARLLFNDDGTAKQMGELDDDVAGAIEGLDVYEEKDFIDGSPIGVTKKIKLGNKNKALDSLNRMLGYNEPDKKQFQNPDGSALNTGGPVQLILPPGMNVHLPSNTDGEPEPAL